MARALAPSGRSHAACSRGAIDSRASLPLSTNPFMAARATCSALGLTLAHSAAILNASLWNESRGSASRPSHAPARTAHRERSTPASIPTSPPCFLASSTAWKRRHVFASHVMAALHLGQASSGHRFHLLGLLPFVLSLALFASTAPSSVPKTTSTHVFRTLMRSARPRVPQPPTMADDRSFRCSWMASKVFLRTWKYLPSR
mmetsp:Transcript_2169/g.14308  ORF Transcript_2169/g.14308 Transcript_2169/m.14308 type:complete len:202 (-) Transcript_2169:277-882(-)